MKILESIQISHYFGADLILDDINVQINSGEKIGLIGVNGSGKSTLIKILNGQYTASSGQLLVNKSQVLATVEQSLTYADGDKIRDVLLNQYKPIIAALREAEYALEAANDDTLPQLLKQYEQARETYEGINGDFLLTNAEKYLDALGLKHSLETCVDTLSGGEQNLVALVAALMIEPDLLILDEPGNHLDIQGLNWLESFLSQWPKAILIISHNRFLLDRVCDSIWELENRKIKNYSGNYSTYRMNKLEGLVNQQADFKANQVKLQRLEALVKKFQELASRTADPAWGKRYRARKSQLKREQNNAVPEPKLYNGKIAVDFQTAASKSDIALQVNDFSFAYPGLELFENAHLNISCGERVALVGANGSGKTTLLKAVLETAMWDNETLRLGPSQNVGYLSQKPEDLDSPVTIEEYFRSLGPLTKNEAFALISPMLFSYADMDKPLSVLSGGEKNRIQLATLMYKKSNFLILDEPTNHMDIASREAIEEALDQFSGTILLVSHDRYFLEKIANKVILLEDRVFKNYDMGFGEFLIESSWLSKSKGKLHSRKKERHSATALEDDTLRLESRIQELEKEKLKLEKAIENEFNKGQHKEANQRNQDLKKLSRILESLYEQWLS